MKRRSTLVAAFALLALVPAALWLCDASQGWQRDAWLRTRLDERVHPGDEPVLDCAQVAAQRPLVLLALGQSNAGNHGATDAAARPPIVLFAQGRCLLARDPLPGATGHGGSIWSRLPAELAAAGLARPVVISVLAIDASRLDDWVRTDGPLRPALAEVAQALEHAGLPAQLVLWQQGEADAREGTSTAALAQALALLADLLQQAGVRAPVLLARSTVCRSAPSAPVRQALDLAAASVARLRLGPDTDTLDGPALRSDGCHFSAPGLGAAARLWARRIMLETTPSGTRQASP